MNVMSESSSKDGSLAAQRLQFLIGRRVQVRVWWSEEGRVASPCGDLFTARLLDVVPIGRDYYFVLETCVSGAQPKRCIIKTAAVLQLFEADAQDA